jgi:hypothetical protein
MFYESYLNSLKADTSFIPESASITDASIFTQRAIQDTFNETFISIAMQEMAYFASLNQEGNSAVSAEVKKSKLERVKQFFKTIWEKIKGFFTKIINAIKDLFTKFKKERGDEYTKYFHHSCEIVKKTDAAKDMKFKLYPEGTGKKLKDKSSQHFGRLAAFADTAGKQCAKSLRDSEAAGQTKMAMLPTSQEEINKFMEAAEKTTDEIVKIKEDATFDDVYKARSDIYSYSAKANSIIDNVKRDYTDAKGTIDKAMNTAKEIVNKNGDLGLYIQGIARVESSITKLESLYLGKIKEIRNNYISVMGKIISLAKKSEKDLKPEKKQVGDMNDTARDLLKNEDVDITINTDDDAEADTSSVEVKDEVEEAFGFFGEEVDETTRSIEESDFYQSFVETFSW